MDNHDEHLSCLADGVQTLNIKALFMKTCEDKTLFDYWNIAVKMQSSEELPRPPAGVDEYAESRFRELRDPGTPQAGGFRDPASKRVASAKKKARGSKGHDLEPETPQVDKRRRRVVLPPDSLKQTKKNVKVT